MAGDMTVVGDRCTFCHVFANIFTFLS